MARWRWSLGKAGPAPPHIQQLDPKAQELMAMKATLEHLVNCRHGDDRPDCPILYTLALDVQPEPKIRAKG